MKLGLSSSEYEFLMKEVVAPLAVQGAKVYCFGSRARGDHQRFSDVDLMVDPQGADIRLGNIQERLVQSNFPYKVDLVLLPDFATAYLESYEQDKVEL